MVPLEEKLIPLSKIYLVVETSQRAFLISVIDDPTTLSPEQYLRFPLNEFYCRAEFWREERNIWTAPKSESTTLAFQPIAIVTALNELTQLPRRLERPSIWLHVIRTP
jgi:hypothetical protein